MPQVLDAPIAWEELAPSHPTRQPATIPANEVCLLVEALLSRLRRYLPLGVGIDAFFMAT